jgi:hypothetical protein
VTAQRGGGDPLQGLPGDGLQTNPRPMNGDRSLIFRYLEIAFTSGSNTAAIDAMSVGGG